MKGIFGQKGVSPGLMLALLIFAGCGRTDAGGVLAGLQSQVRAIRAAAQDKDTKGALERLNGLRARVISLRGQSTISESQARRILAAAAEVQANLGALRSSAGAPVPAPPTPAQPTLQVPLQEFDHPPAGAGRGVDGARGRRGGANGRPGEEGE